MLGRYGHLSVMKPCKPSHGTDVCICVRIYEICVVCTYDIDIRYIQYDMCI